MGTISSGTGLISGLDHTSIIEQLLSVESQPITRLQTRMSSIDAQKTAYLDISARLTALLARFSVLGRTSSFKSATATSSNASVLSATAALGTPTGTYQFSVRALAATHQLVSRGFDSRAAILSPGSLTIESAQARVDRQTRLEQLNGGSGIQRGSFKLTNAAGQQATIDVTDAVTLDDVVDRINAAGLSVRAAISGDGLALTDSSSGTGHLQVQEISGGRTAASLGFGIGHTSDADGDKTLAGSTLMYVTASTSLSALNDGLGLRRSVAGNDLNLQVGDTTVGVDLSEIIRPDTRLARLNHGSGVQLGRIEITAKDGAKTEVDLSGAQTVGDVQQRLQGAFGGGRLSVVLTGDHLLLSDGSTVETGKTAYTFAIRDLTGNSTRDLGLDGASSEGRITGRGVLQVSTVGDVLAAINYAAGNVDAAKQPLVQAELASDGQSLVLRSVSGVGGPITVSGTAGTLADLGLQAGTVPDIGGGAVVHGARIIGGLNTVLLKSLSGGVGFKLGTVHVAAGDQGVDVDLTSATTLTDVVNRMNDAAQAAGVNVTVGYDPTGVRLLLANRDGGTDTLSVTDVSGTFAAAAGLTQSGTTIRSANLQRQYVGETTALSTLSNGRGVNLGTLKITNSLGVFKTLTLDANSAKTVRDVISAINSLGLGVTASINATGDGLLLTDTAGGTGTMKVEDQAGTSARDLNILGSATNGQIDGSYEFKFEVTGSDTLESLANRITARATLAQATLLNDGTGVAPYRLNIASQMSGARGALVLDDSGLDLGIVTLAAAQDARMLFGGSSSGVLLASAENTFSGVVSGLDVTVSDVSSSPITVKVERSYTDAIDAIKGFVSDYNSAVSRMREVSGYDQDTEKKGVLLGESALTSSEYRLYRMINRSFAAAGATVTRLSQIGLTTDGSSQLVFDEEKFKKAYAANPDGVTKFFTDTTNGVAAVMKADIERITGTSGLIPSRTDTLDQTKEMLQERVDRMNALLERKKTRLQLQFQAMETTLAGLQSQGQALSSLSSLWSSTSSSSTSSSSSSS